MISHDYCITPSKVNDQSWAAKMIDAQRDGMRRIERPTSPET